MLADLENALRRMEQQITAFEKLHHAELQRFQEQFETYQRLQNDEIQMLRAQLQKLDTEIAQLRALADEPTPATPPTPGVTRRDFLTHTIKALEAKLD